MATNIFEKYVAFQNENIFYREFSFTNNTFKPDAQTELELGDHIVWLEDILFIFQLKQREEASSGDDEQEKKWFEKTVIKKGSQQIRNSLSYLKTHGKIEIENQRGHKFNAAQFKVDENTLVKIILYSPNSRGLPDVCRQIKHHYSRTGGGFIHVLLWDDYQEICAILITPIEIFRYFQFREQVITQWEMEVKAITEKALIGQFIAHQAGNTLHQPNQSFEQELAQLKEEDFDISFILSNLGDRIEYSYRQDNQVSSATDYYGILRELAKLGRYECVEFKKRLKLSLEDAKANQFRLPMRIIASTDCGFVFIPLERGVNRFVPLRNLTAAAKYDGQLNKVVGMTFIYEGKDILIDFAYMQSTWRFDAEWDAMLKDNNPFPPFTKTLDQNYKLNN